MTKDSVMYCDSFVWQFTYGDIDSKNIILKINLCMFTDKAVKLPFFYKHAGDAVYTIQTAQYPELLFIIVTKSGEKNRIVIFLKSPYLQNWHLAK